MRRLADAFASALDSLAQHKLRTTLTMLGMMFGVGAVIAMLSIGAGAANQALALIDRLGTRNIVLREKELKADELKEIRKRSLGLSQRDVEALQEAVPGVAFAAPRIEVEPYKIIAAGATTIGKVHGIGHRHREVAPFDVSEGRFLDAGDESTHAQVAVIGAAARRDLFGADSALGKDLKINDVWFEVVGVLAPEASTTSAAGTPGALQGVSIESTDRDIYIPFTTALRKLDRDPLRAPLGEIVVRLADGVAATDTAAVIGALIDRLHGGAADYDIVVPAALLEHSRQTQRLFNLVTGLIAGISLLVGGIGIMNIMLASVLEQTREIGVRRAVGARRADIRFQFLVTAFSIAWLGGLAGVALGLAISRGVAAYANWPTAVTVWSISLSLGVSLVVGVASGLYPAVRAARLDPVVALHAE
jgi:putative ABC transport system permease protein